MKHQIAVQLDTPDFERLKRLALAQGAPYAAIIAQALTGFEQTRAGASGATSDTTSGATSDTIFCTLDLPTRRAWKAKVLELRAQGESYMSIAKTLYRAHRLTSTDGLPLSASTIRGLAAL